MTYLTATLQIDGVDGEEEDGFKEFVASLSTLVQYTPWNCRLTVEEQASTGNATQVGNSVGSKEPDISEVTITIGKHTHTFTLQDFKNLLFAADHGLLQNQDMLQAAISVMILQCDEEGK